MSKFLGKAKSSKLRESLETANQNKEKVLRQIKLKDHPRSYRLDAEVVNVLKDTLDRINEVAPKKISEARLIKALIMLSKKIDEDEIIKAVKEVW